MKATVRRISFQDDCRILAISDIHGNLPYLKGLLKRVRFSLNDILVLVGDMMEKGAQSLDTLHYIMELERTHHVYPICGNCDGWNRFIDMPSDDADTHIRDYILYGQGPWRHGLLYQMCEQLGITICGPFWQKNLQKNLRFFAAFPPSWKQNTIRLSTAVCRKEKWRIWMPFAV